MSEKLSAEVEYVCTVPLRHKHERQRKPGQESIPKPNITQLPNNLCSDKYVTK